MEEKMRETRARGFRGRAALTDGMNNDMLKLFM
jgi:hypothetical protein